MVAIHENCLRVTATKPRPPTNSRDSNHVIRHRCTLMCVGLAHTPVMAPTKESSHETLSPQVSPLKALQFYKGRKEPEMNSKGLAMVRPTQQDIDSKTQL